MRGQGEGLGPTLDPKPHGPPYRGVRLPTTDDVRPAADHGSTSALDGSVENEKGKSVFVRDGVLTSTAKEQEDLPFVRPASPVKMTPSVVQAAMTLARLQEGVENMKAEARAQREQHGPFSAMFFNDRAEFHADRSWDVKEDTRPLTRPTRREGRVVALPASSATGSGQGFRRHVPLFTNLRVNDVDGPALSSLVDTGASLSSIDAKLLERLGGSPQGPPISVHGIGHTKSLGFVTITCFLDAHDDRGLPVHLEVRQDFHVLPTFAPGMILGLDFISTHQISLDPARGKARIGEYTVPVRESMRTPHAVEAELCLVSEVTLQPQCHQWVPVDVGGLTSDVDYTVHPRLSGPIGEDACIAGPAALFSPSSKHILLTNFADHPVTLARRTAVADAIAAHLGDTSAAAGHSFELRPGSAARSTSTFVAQPPAEPPFDREILPVDMFDGDGAFGADLAKDCPVTTVDGHWRVGLDASGEPHQPIVDVLRRHPKAFALEDRPGRVVDPATEMGIQLKPGADLRPEAPRRASPEKRKAMDSTIDQLLSWDVIEPSSSPVSFPVLMVRQRDKWRFCVDYRQLNTATIPDCYPLPVIDAVFNTLAGKSIFSSLDAIRGYHQLSVKSEDRWKTAFVCHKGLFQYKTVPFGLRNAPAVFQRLMDRILGSMRWKDAVIYIDDIVVASRTMDEHVTALETLLSRAEAIGLNFSPAKCTFGVPSLVLLGRKVSGAGLAVWKDRASAVTELRPPKTLRELYHVLGLFGYYRPFIPDYAAIAEPLTKLTKGWKYEFADGRYRLTNAEGRPMSADKVVFPWSLAAQRSFDALKAAIAQPPVLAHPDPSRPYLLYVDASKHAFAAVLHQVFEKDLPTDVVQSPVAAQLNTIHVGAVPPAIARDRWSSWLEQDRYFNSILKRTSSGVDTGWKLEDGLLVRHVDGRLALPFGALPDLLRAAHDDNGHFGFYKTFLTLSRDFWRPGLATAVRAWVRHCDSCQAIKLPRRVGALRIDDDPQDPFEAVAVDLALGLPRTRNGVDAMLVMQDVFSRMVLLEPCSSDITAEGIAAIVSNRILRMGWRPRRLISDSEARMTGSVMRALAASLGAVVTPSPPHHQQANSVERFIQTVQGVLRSLCISSTAAWDRRAVPAAELALNSTPSVSTGHRPFDLVFISHPRIVHAVFDASEHDGVGAFPERLAAAQERLAEARRVVDLARAEQKRRYDQRRRGLPALSPGDRVYVRLTDRPIAGAITSKLSPRKLGPYTVSEVLSPHRIRIALPAPLRINDEFSIEQLDVLPTEADPFALSRAPAAPDSGLIGDTGLEESVAGDSESSRMVNAPNTRPARTARLPAALREYDLAEGALHTMSDATLELLRVPSSKPRIAEIDGKEVVLEERPVAFLSRLTTISEKRLVAPELELSCLAWAFGRLMHLLEGALVTVVTDHSPLGPMLTAKAGVEYGPIISKCRAMLMPHIPNLRFVHKPGRRHTNADALSRLVSSEEVQALDDPGRSFFEAGDVLDKVLH